MPPADAKPRITSHTDPHPTPDFASLPIFEKAQYSYDDFNRYQCINLYNILNRSNNNSCRCTFRRVPQVRDKKAENAFLALKEEYERKIALTYTCVVLSDVE